MDTRAPELDPASLPAGTRVGPWLILGWRGRGAFGAVYRAVRADQPRSEPVALKLALSPLDPRFERERTLLARLDHPHVPRLLGHGQWQLAGRLHPFLIIQWVEGKSLYDWVATHNPSCRQVMRVLAQVARALHSTHSTGGIHRDVKGDNILVRADGSAFLVDFGSCHHSGASLLTFEPLPPGTPAYRSPEAWRFSIEFNHLRTAHYPAQPTDDLFALGVTSYHLVTYEYPPPTDPGEPSARIWYVDNPGPRAPWAINPHVDPQLSSLILRMLSVRPEARGTVTELAGLLEQEAACAGPKADQPLFARLPQPAPSAPREHAAAIVVPGHLQLPRALEQVREVQQRAAEARAQAARQEAEELARAMASSKAPAEGLVWLPWLGVGIALFLLVLGARWHEQEQPLEEAPIVAHAESRDGGTQADGGTVELAQEVLTAPMKQAAPPRGTSSIALDLPPKPLPGQIRPDSSGKCRRPGEVAINGGCWLRLADVSPPCAENEYEWMGVCYHPVYATSRQPTSDPPALPRDAR